MEPAWEPVCKMRFERTKEFWDSRCSSREDVLDRSASWTNSLIEKGYPTAPRSTSWTHLLIEEGYPAILRFSWTDAKDQLPEQVAAEDHDQIKYRPQSYCPPPCQVSDRLIDAAYTSYFAEINSAVADDSAHRLQKAVTRTLDMVRVLQALNSTRLDHEDRMMNELSSLASTLEVIDADVTPVDHYNGARAKTRELPMDKRPWFPPVLDDDDSSGSENTLTNLSKPTVTPPGIRKGTVWTSNSYEPTPGTSGILQHTSRICGPTSESACVIEEIDELYDSFDITPGTSSKFKPTEGLLRGIESTDDLLCGIKSTDKLRGTLEHTTGILGILKPLDPLDKILGPFGPSAKLPDIHEPIDNLFRTTKPNIKMLNTKVMPLNELSYTTRPSNRSKVYSLESIDEQLDICGPSTMHSCTPESISELEDTSGPTIRELGTLELLDEVEINLESTVKVPDTKESVNGSLAAICPSKLSSPTAGPTIRELGTLELLDEVEINLEPTVKVPDTKESVNGSLAAICPSTWSSPTVQRTSKMGSKGRPHQIKRSKPKSLAYQLGTSIALVFLIIFVIVLLSYVGEWVYRLYVGNSNENNNCEVWTGNHVKWEHHSLDNCFTSRVKYREGPS